MGQMLAGFQIVIGAGRFKEPADLSRGAEHLESPVCLSGARVSFQYDMQT